VLSALGLDEQTIGLASGQPVATGPQ